MTAPHKIASALGRATAITSALAWISLILWTGASIPRATLVAATLAVALAVAAYRAAQSGQYWILLVVATFGALTPPDLGDAPIGFKYVGVIAIGYAASALLHATSLRDHRRAS
jgi:hypothetical protein